MLPGLAALAGLLDAREDLPELPTQLPSGPQPPPLSAEQLQALAASLAEVERRLEVATARLESAHQRLLRLRALPAPLLQALEPDPGRRAQLLTACEREEALAASYAQTLTQHRERVSSALARGRAEHRATASYRAAHLRERARGPRLDPLGPQAPLGSQIGGAVGQAVEELHDQLLTQELEAPDQAPEFFWDLKDRLDVLRDGLPTIEQAPLEQGWSALCATLAELEAVQLALSSGPEARS